MFAEINMWNIETIVKNNKANFIYELKLNRFSSLEVSIFMFLVISEANSTIGTTSNIIIILPLDLINIACLYEFMYTWLFNGGKHKLI